MPIFEYACRECGAKFERLIRRESELASLTCPTCGATKVEKQLSTFAPQMGGKDATRPMCPSGGVCPTPGKCGLN